MERIHRVCVKQLSSTSPVTARFASPVRTRTKASEKRHRVSLRSVRRSPPVKRTMRGLVTLTLVLFTTEASAFAAPAASALHLHPVAHRNLCVSRPARTSIPTLADTGKKRTSRDEWSTLVKLCAPDWPLLVGAFTGLGFAATGEALLPALQGAALNAALGLNAPTGGALSVRTALVRLGGVGVATAIFTGIRGFLFWICGSRLVQRLRATLFTALLRQPQAFHDEQGPGELSSRLATDCVKLGDVLSLNVNIVLRQVMQSLVGVSIILRINARLAGLVLAGVAFRAAFSHVYAKASRRISKAQQDALAASSGVAEQCLSLIKVVRSHGNEEAEGRRYGAQLQRLLELQTRQGLLYGGSRVVNGGLSAAMLTGVLALGASLVGCGVLPREALTSFVLYVTFISDASGDVADQWSRIQEALGAATGVFDYLIPRPLQGTSPDSADAASGTADGIVVPSAPPSPPAPARSADSEALGESASSRRGALTFEGVDFAYPSRPSIDVFESLSLAVSPGERVAIVGGSGSGKSTIFALAMRFYAPSAGRVLLDGADVASEDETALRRQIAWVQQEPPLFPNCTIRENIGYGLPDVSDEAVVAAAREANAFDFISALPQGFETRIGAAGAALSGGQKQRVALARALVRDPALLLLDEATSALDPESEELVEAAIRRASEDRTVLFTTHKVSQAQFASRIIVMSHGAIVEQGTHAELIAKGGAYAGLFRLGDSVSEDEASAVVDLSLV